MKSKLIGLFALVAILGMSCKKEDAKPTGSVKTMSKEKEPTQPYPSPYPWGPDGPGVIYPPR